MLYLPLTNLFLISPPWLVKFLDHFPFHKPFTIVKIRANWYGVLEKEEVYFGFTTKFYSQGKLVFETLMFCLLYKYTKVQCILVGGLPMESTWQDFHWVLFLIDGLMWITINLCSLVAQHFGKVCHLPPRGAPKSSFHNPKLGLKMRKKRLNRTSEYENF